MTVVGWKYDGPVSPSGKPIPGVTNLGDVEWALTKARRFIFKGGDPAEVEEYINVWLDYREKLRGSSLEHVGTVRELTPRCRSDIEDDAWEKRSRMR